jgi:hypothetical protein
MATTAGTGRENRQIAQETLAKLAQFVRRSSVAMKPLSSAAFIYVCQLAGFLPMVAHLVLKENLCSLKGFF